MTRTFFLCADDFAQNEAISEGILYLATRNRINAVSCLVTSPHWPQLAPQLSELKQSIFIGLHLNFTEGGPLSIQWKTTYQNQFSNLTSLITQSYLKKLNKQVVEEELWMQLQTFIETTQQFPDFIDGHQHVHQLPIIRDALFSLYKKHQLTIPCRNTFNGWQKLFSLSGFPKRQVITLLGGHTFKKQLAQQEIKTNTSFNGIYSFSNAQYYRHYFKQFLSKTKSQGLIMCHPGLISNDITDPIRFSRQDEFNYFLSDYFITDLYEHQCMLSFKQGV